MTSYFARYGALSRQTNELEYYNAHPRSVGERLDFYMQYLQDVVPYGVTVQHIPSDIPENKSEEIHLLTPSGKIFMSGLVSRDRNHNHTEDIAASEAYTMWLESEFVQDGQNWRFFTALDALRFFNSQDGDSWDMKQKCNPMDRADAVAEFLLQQYDSIGGIIGGYV